MVSPCRTCAHAGRSKNHPDCIHCRERQLAWDGYVRMEANVKKTEGGTKTCTDPKCPHEGKPQPVENFRKNHKSMDGRLNTCNACMRRKLQEGQKKRAAKKQAEADLARCPDPGEGLKSREEIIRDQATVVGDGRETAYALQTHDHKFDHRDPLRPSMTVTVQGLTTVPVDFSDNKDLLDQFVRKAADQLRTPENMLLYLAKRFVESKPMEWV